MYSFTKIEDLIKLDHPNRRAIVDKNQGTDYSGSNRIKYELWETRSPMLSYFLVLGDNVIISNTIGHAVKKLNAEKIRPVNLTVLRPRPGDANLIPNLLKEAGIHVNMAELTYKEYIWDYCIDDHLKSVNLPSVIPNYTDQSLQYEGEDECDIIIAESAKDKLVEVLVSCHTSTVG